MAEVVVPLLRLLVAFFLVFLNGFFVAAEFAFVRIRPTRIDALIEKGRGSAKLLEAEIQHLDDYLAVCQLGITISSLGLGWIGEPAVAALIDPLLAPVLPERTVHLVSVALGFSFITFLHVVFGELAPKTFAIQEAERIALLVAVPMRVFYYLFIPGIVVFNGTANFFTRLAGVSPASETDEAHTEEEIRMVLTQSQKKGHIDVDEVEMIESVFELEETVAREIMVPRPDVVTVPAEMALAELRSVTAAEDFTRYLVLDPEADERPVGFVHVKDVLRAIESEREGKSRPTARDLAREVLFIPEDRRVDDILTEFQNREIQMAVVIDEWGEFEGIVTIEDVLEEIVGDIRDEFDERETEPSIEEVREGVYSVDGGVPIGNVNDAVDTHFESEEFDTIGGLVLSRLGRAPEVDDRIEADGYTLRVDEVDDTRVSRITIERTSDRDGGSTD